MKQFVSPQFIDVEDRIIGPITTRQFVMMVLGGIMAFAAFKIFDQISAIGIVLVIVCLVVIFGFVKINGRHFGDFVKSMFEVLRRPRLRVWYKEVSKTEIAAEQKVVSMDEVKTDLLPSRKALGSKNLSQLALIVDTGGRYGG